MKKCPYCGWEIAKDAVSCGHCFAELPAEKPKEQPEKADKKTDKE